MLSCCLLSQHDSMYLLQFEGCTDAYLFHVLQSMPMRKGIRGKRAAATVVDQGPENTCPNNKVTMLHIMCILIQACLFHLVQAMLVAAT